ncbi:MAG TPA: site-specific DNA-methyltransferase [Herpetosiphonaceae bacterium]
MPNLTEAQRQQIIELLRRGMDLPHAYKDLLFPPARQECALVYAGKEPHAAILADSATAELREIRRFGADTADWRNRLIFGDNMQALKALLGLKAQGQLASANGSPGVKLVYIDPPFATRQEFQGTHEERAYHDRVAGVQFVEFLRKRLVLLKALLAEDGVLCVHLDFRKKHYIKVILDEIFGEQNFRNEIAVSRVKKSIREHERVRKLNEEFDTILLYASGEAATLRPPTRRVAREARWHAFDAAGLRTGMDYDLFGHRPPPGRHWMYIKERAEQMIAAGRLRPHPRTGRPQYLIAASAEDLCNNLWTDISAYAFTAGYPTEKSEALLRRVLEMASQPGDLVLDAFAGSGTTLAVAEKLGRRWIGVDCGKLAIYTSQRRLLSLDSGNDPNGGPLQARPFALYNAGLYDFARRPLRSWALWRQRALALFGCRDAPHTIGDVQLDGYRDHASVLLFDHNRQGALLDYGTIDALHRRLGAALDGRCWIIAPAASVTFLEDTVQRDAARYTILRVPYSIVDALHAPPGSSAPRPMTGRIDRRVNSLGFDLMRPPQVACRYTIRQRPGQVREADAVIAITAFASATPAGASNGSLRRETLSLVLVDYDYPYDPLRSGVQPPCTIDAVFDAAQLAAAGWEVRLPCEALGATIMLIYVDIYGNEYAEIKALADFEQLGP